MKITKEQLKQIIKEELAAAFEGMPAGDVDEGLGLNLLDKVRGMVQKPRPDVDSDDSVANDWLKSLDIGYDVKAAADDVSIDPAYAQHFNKLEESGDEDGAIAGDADRIPPADPLMDILQQMYDTKNAELQSTELGAPKYEAHELLSMVLTSIKDDIEKKLPSIDVTQTQSKFDRGIELEEGALEEMSDEDAEFMRQYYDQAQQFSPASNAAIAATRAERRAPRADPEDKEAVKESDGPRSAAYWSAERERIAREKLKQPPKVGTVGSGATVSPKRGYRDGPAWNPKYHGGKN